MRLNKKILIWTTALLATSAHVNAELLENEIPSMSMTLLHPHSPPFYVRRMGNLRSKCDSENNAMTYINPLLRDIYTDDYIDDDEIGDYDDFIYYREDQPYCKVENEEIFCNLELMTYITRNQCKLYGGLLYKFNAEEQCEEDGMIIRRKYDNGFICIGVSCDIEDILDMMNEDASIGGESCTDMYIGAERR